MNKNLLKIRKIIQTRGVNIFTFVVSWIWFHHTRSRIFCRLLLFSSLSSSCPSHTFVCPLCSVSSCPLICIIICDMCVDCTRSSRPPTRSDPSSTSGNPLTTVLWTILVSYLYSLDKSGTAGNNRIGWHDKSNCHASMLCLYKLKSSFRLKLLGKITLTSYMLAYMLLKNLLLLFGLLGFTHR